MAKLNKLDYSDSAELKVISRSEKSLDKYGWNYGGMVILLTKKQLDSIIKGKVVALNDGEYSTFISVRDEDISND